MLQYRSIQLVIVALLSIFSSAIQARPLWYNHELQQLLAVQTRYDFQFGDTSGGIIFLRLPPTCRNTHFYFLFGPAVFAPELHDQSVTIIFSVDDLPAREGRFISHIQQREDGQYLLVRMVSLERAATFQAEIEHGIELELELEQALGGYQFRVPLTGSSRAFEQAVATCIKQTKQLEQQGNNDNFFPHD